MTYTLSGATTGTGSSLDNVAFGLGATLVTWRATDATGNYEECSFTVNVAGVPFNGKVTYYNTANTPLDGVVVNLMEEGTQNVITYATTGSDGSFGFANVCPGTYDVVMATTKPVRSINSTDAGAVNYWNVSGVGTPKVYEEI
jgi:hypothetical protein